MIAVGLVTLAVSAVPAMSAAEPNLAAAELRRATVPGGALAGAAAEYVSEDGQIYLLGGYRPATYTSGGSTLQTRQLTSAVYRYDPGLDQFTEAKPLPFPLALAAHAYVPAEHKIYLFGGLRHPGVENSCRDACTVSNQVLTYDVLTGETQVLSATVPGARARAAAALHPPTGTIYLVGGVTEAAAFSPAVTGSQTLVRFDVASGAFTGSRSLPTSGIYTGAYFVPHVHARTDFEYVQPAPGDRGYLAFVGTAGFVEFYPTLPDPFAPFGKVGKEADVTNAGYVGAPTVYVPTSDEGWTVGGYCNGTSNANCDDAGSGRMRHNRFVTNLFGAGRERGIPRGSPTNSPTLVEDSLDDGAAAYVPTLDRVIVFGGFMGKGDDVVPKGGVPDVWDDAPTSDQYRDDVVSVSPTHQTANGVTGPIPVRSPALVEGQTKSVVVHREDSAQTFAIGLQTSYRPPGGGDELALRILPATMSGTNDVTATFTVPRDLSPGPDERAVGLCAVPLDGLAFPNCREVALTTNPGFIDVEVTGTPEAGGTAAALTRPTVQILDEDGGVVQEQALAATESTFTSDGLASGVYTINVWREFVEGDTLVYKPTSTLARVFVGRHSAVTVNLAGSTQIGPVAKSVVASADQLAGPDIGTFVSFKRASGSLVVSRSRLPDVVNTFSIEGFVEPLAHQGRRTARVDFVVNGQTFSDTNSSDGWAVPIDMTDVLLPGDNVLRVRATDDAPTPHTGPTLEFHIRAVASKPLDKALNPQVEFDRDAEVYTSRFIIPANPRLRFPDNPPAELDLVFFKLYSQARADIQLNERFGLDGSWQATGNAAALLQILSWKRDQYNFAFPFTVTPTYAADGSVRSYTISTGRIDLTKNPTTFSADQMTQLIENPYGDSTLKRIAIDEWLPIFSGPVFTLRDLARVKSSFDLKYRASVVIEGTISGQDWSVVDIRVIPRPELAQRTVFELDLLMGLASGGIHADTNLTYDQPVVYRPGHNPVVFLDTPCVRMLMTGDAWVGLAARKWHFVNVTFFKKEIPSGCFVQDANATSRRTSAALDAPDVMAQPAMATGPGANPHSMRLWVEDRNATNGVTDAELRFSFDGGADGLVYGPGQQTDPKIAFVGPNRAVATWTQTGVTVAQAGSLTPLQILRKQEVMAAVWDGDSWSAPTRLSSNLVGDGRPVVAGDPSSGRAVVAWVRDPDGKPLTKRDWLIAARTLDPASGQWSPTKLTGAADGIADFEPAVEFDTAGSKAWLVWVRDGDGSVLTNGDRRAAFRTWNGAGWSPIERPLAWPAGALHPDLAFSPISPRPLISLMSATTTESADGAKAAAGIGTQNMPYAIWGAPGIAGWNVQQIGDPKQGPTDDVRGEWPEASFLPGSDHIGVIAFRDFGGAGTRPSAGQAAIVEGSLGATTARWGPVGTLTSPRDMVWQLAASGGGAQSTTDLSLMGVLAPAPAQGAAATKTGLRLTKLADSSRVFAVDDGGAVFSLEQNTTGTNLELAGLAISDPVPAPGAVQTVTATVRNPDLQPVSKAAAPSPPTFSVDLYLNDELLETKQYDGDLLFNETVPLEFQYVSSGRPERLRAELRFDQDLGAANNVATARVGVLTPVAGLQASRLPWGNVEIGWLPLPDAGPTVYYRVLRSSATAGPWRPVGVTAGTSFTDVAPVAAGRYRVEAIDALGRRAPASPAVSAQKVATRLTVRAARAASRVNVSGTVTPAAPNGTVRVELFVRRDGQFVRVGVNQTPLGAAVDPNGDGIPSSNYQTQFARPSGGGTCRVNVTFGGNATASATSAATTFSC